MIEIVIKRDGREVEFESDRIVNAIVKAMNKTEKGLDIELANRIADSISKTDKKKLEVEDIHTLVQNKLMSSSRKDVAIEYITYRNERSKKRQRKNALNQRIENILMCKNIENSNANVDEYSFGGRKFESAGALHKDFALNNLIREEVVNAYKENRLYIHDLDSYDVGMHNCLFTDLQRLLNNGFSTRNGDVRPANSISTAMQLVAVIFQCQSQVQFGGVGSVHLDFDLAPFVAKSFYKLFLDGLYEHNDIENPKDFTKEFKDKITLSNVEWLKQQYPKATRYALRKLDCEGLQSAQALFHNLNTLESRPGSQLPFTSINYGRDTSPEGRKVNEWLLKASLEGIGKYNMTSIFPISIFMYKKGVNDKPGTPNYDLKKLAIQSLCKRIYPNFVNGDFSNHVEDPNNPDTWMATMGCRTMLGKDRFSGTCNKVGRGNASPVTINLPKIAIKHGICLGERTEADLDGFWKELDEVLELAATALVDRFYHMCSQSVKSAPFMYNNGTILDSEKGSTYESLKHNTQAIGYIGITEMCQALFGKNHVKDQKVREFALSVVERLYSFVQQSSNKYNLNFSLYGTPAENLCRTMMENLKKEFGIIPNVTEKDYLTNSHHVPVWEKVTVFEKIQIEAPFCKYPTGGTITYVELGSTVTQNPEAVEKIIDYAMDLDIPYLAINFPIDTCLECGYQAEINANCPVDGSDNIQRLRRVTGYLTTDYRNFNKGKIAETLDRVKHTIEGE